MPYKLLKTCKAILLTGLKNELLPVRPALIQMMKPEIDCTLLEFLDGESLRVKETVEEISGMIARENKSLARRAYAYATLKRLEDEDRKDVSDLFFDDRLPKIEALKEMAYAKNRPSHLPRLFSIYKSILTPFALMRLFSSSTQEELTSYEKDLCEKTIEQREKLRKMALEKIKNKCGEKPQKGDR